MSLSPAVLDSPELPALEATIEAAAGLGIMREPVSVEDAIAVDNNSRGLAKSLLPEIAVKAF
jgi:hypothetical protein